jgi:hypothetical protein
MKIFCYTCKHLHLDAWNEYRCSSPKNKKDIWLQPNFEWAERPENINKNNDCSWFEEDNGGMNE